MSNFTQEQTQPNSTPTLFEEDGVFVALTHDTLDAGAIMNKVRSPKAGAIVLFAGTL
jgi:molybdopterin synthase catalytic subunit